MKTFLGTCLIISGFMFLGLAWPGFMNLCDFSKLILILWFLSGFFAYFRERLCYRRHGIDRSRKDAIAETLIFLLVGPFILCLAILDILETFWKVRCKGTRTWLDSPSD